MCTKYSVHELARVIYFVMEPRIVFVVDFFCAKRNFIFWQTYEEVSNKISIHFKICSYTCTRRDVRHSTQVQSLAIFWFTFSENNSHRSLFIFFSINLSCKVHLPNILVWLIVICHQMFFILYFRILFVLSCQKYWWILAIHSIHQTGRSFCFPHVFITDN